MMSSSPREFGVSRAAFWSLIEVGLRYGGQLIVTLLLARLLLPSDFGQVAMLLVVTSIAALFVEAGIGLALVQKHALTDDDETTAFWFGAVSSSVLWLAIAAASSFIADAFDEPELAPLLPVIALTLPLTALALVPDALLTRSLRFDRRAQIEAVSAAVSTSLAVALAILGHGVWALVAQALAAAATRAAACWLLSAWRPAGRLRWTSLMQLLGFGGNLMAAGLLDVISLRLQSVLIGRFHGTTALGLYSVAHTSFQAPVSIVSAVLNKVGLATLSRASSRTGQLQAMLRMSVRGATFLFAPLMLAISLLAEPIVMTAFGSPWLESAPLLAILALSGMFWPVHVLNQVAITAMGRSDLFLRLSIAKKCLAIALIVLGSVWGVLGVACALLTSSILSLFLNARYLSRLIQYGAYPQWFDHRHTLMALAVQAATGALILVTMEPGGWRTATLAAGPLMAYVATAGMVRHSSLSDIGQLLRMARANLATASAGDAR